MSRQDNIFDQWAGHYDSDIVRAEQNSDWMYKDYTKILNRVVAMIKDWLSGQKDILIVDIGAGTGNLTKMIHDAGFATIGIEPSEKMREQFNKKLPSLKNLRGDFLNIPLQGNCADIIVSSYAWHHLTPGDKEQSIHEMSRVLKGSGLIVIADLMFADKSQRAAAIKNLKQQGQADIIKDIESEYYADVRWISKCFNEYDFLCDNVQMTDYVWIVKAEWKG